MTQIPRSRMARALIGEWRRRADEYRISDPATADAYARCADELNELDVLAGSGTDGMAASDRTDAAAVAPWIVAGGLALGVVGIAQQVARRRRRSWRSLREDLVVDVNGATPPHGDKLLRHV